MGVLLDLLINLLTFASLALVALEKATPDREGPRREALNRFLRQSVLASPAKVQRRAAAIVARTLKRFPKPFALLGGVLAPLPLVLRRAWLIFPLLFGALAVQFAWAFIAWSPWLRWVLPGVGAAGLIVLCAAPGVYPMVAADTLLRQIQAGAWVRIGDVEHVLLPHGDRAERALWWLSFIHPKVRRYRGQVGLANITPRHVLWLASLLPLCLAPLFLAQIDGFFAAPMALQLAVIAVSAGTVFVFVVALVMVVVMFGSQSRGTDKHPRWHIEQSQRATRAFLPTALIAGGLSTFYGVGSGDFAGGGGGWFVAVVIAMDVASALVTAWVLGRIVKTRGRPASAMLALAWLATLAGVVAPTKLYIAVYLSATPLSLVEAFSVVTLQVAPLDPHILGLALVAQSGLIYWAAYLIVLVVLLSLSLVAWVIHRALGLAMQSLSPLEFLAAYLTFMATVAATAKAVIELS